MSTYLHLANNIIKNFKRGSEMSKTAYIVKWVDSKAPSSVISTPIQASSAQEAKALLEAKQRGKSIKIISANPQ